MNLKCKKLRPISRQDGFSRDARLIIIATEDTYIPEQYFLTFRDPRLKVEILPTEDGRSNPQSVLERLDQYKAQYQTLDEDEFWLMLDRDHWTAPNHIRNYTRVSTEAIQKGYQLAHSNPCFEFMLLLHFQEFDGTTQYNNCGEVISRLREVLGQYDKKTLNPSLYTPETIRAAVARAETLDTPSAGRWPQSNGTPLLKKVWVIPGQIDIDASAVKEGHCDKRVG